MTASDKCTNLIKYVLLCRSHPHKTFAAGARILDTYHESRPCSPNEAFGFELIRTGGLTVY